MLLQNNDHWSTVDDTMIIMLTVIDTRRRFVGRVVNRAVFDGGSGVFDPPPPQSLGQS